MMRLTWRQLSLLMILGMLWGVPTRLVQAQGPIWQASIKLYQTEDFVSQPLLLGDMAGRLHLLWNEIRKEEGGEPSGPPVIYYMVKENDQWSEPVDVFVQLQGRMEQLGGVVDPYGHIHLVHGGVNEPFVYSHSVDTDARSAQSWMQPITLADHRQLGGSIALDSAGNLHVVYGAMRASIYHQVSSDWGQSWSAPNTAASFLPDQAISSGSLLLTVAPDGKLHMTWSLVPLPDGYPPLGSFYTRSTDEGQNWSKPIEIAPVHYEMASILAGDDGRVHVLYIGRVGVGGRYHRWSSNGGLTWSDPLQLSAPEEGAGLSGGDLALDSADRLHAVFGLGNDRVIAHSRWDEHTWSKWEKINESVPGVQEVMSIEVTQGNHLHVVWESDHNSIWYVEGRSAAPEIPAVSFIPLPTISSLTMTPEATRVAPARVLTPTPMAVTPQADQKSEELSQSSGVSGSIALLTGVLPSVLVVGGVLVWHLAVKRKG